MAVTQAERKSPKVVQTIDIPSLRSPIPVELGEGRGIVIPGGGIYLRSAWVTVRMIRHRGCDLPIELWLLPWETISDRERNAFGLYGVEIRTAEAGYCLNESIQSARWKRPIWLAGWQLKAQAVLQSRFRQVIYLDADCYPVESGWEMLLTESPGTFLGDVTQSEWLLPAESCGAVGVDRPMPVDSGAFYVDKSGPWTDAVGALNGPEHVRQIYEMFFGDKDLWTIAHIATGCEYQIFPRGALLPGAVGVNHYCVGLMHRTGDKFTDGVPANTPQVKKAILVGDDLTSQFLRSWPPLEMGLEDMDLVRGVVELDEYHLDEIGWAGYVVDAGAHVGSFSAEIHRRWPEAAIIAIEPSPRNCVLFRKNAPKADLVPVAIGRHRSTGTLIGSPGESCYSVRMDRDGDVPIVTLSEILNLAKWSHVDLLKIDIEGAELGVFQDLANSRWLGRIRRIVGEWHDTDVLMGIVELIRKTHHMTICVHHWNNGYFEAVRNDRDAHWQS